MSEVNAWTYWQGYGVRNPKVMIVGQDWGKIEGNQNFFDAIDEMGEKPKDNRVQYFKYCPEAEKAGSYFATDKNLAKCLSFIGYEDALHIMYPDLFFTNLIPGYRTTGKNTSGFKASWIDDKVKEEFIELVNILNPKVIICLGKDTFTHVCRIYGIKGVLIKIKWNDYLDTQHEPIEIVLENDIKTHIFASAHPGYFGIMNRGEKNVYNDWKKINQWMKKM